MSAGETNALARCSKGSDSNAIPEAGAVVIANTKHKAKDKNFFTKNQLLYLKVLCY
jgi:hypothetical protein